MEYVERPDPSGLNRSRAARAALLRDARSNHFNGVLVSKMERIACSVPHFLKLVQTFDAQGIRFIVPSQHIDTGPDSPMRTCLMHLVATLLDTHRELISERVRADAKEAKQQGKPWGRAKKLLNREEAEQLRSKGMTLREISRQLEIPVATLHRKLS
jgi:DNA invertase Pin-like site-specific DNA recombinase